jgi:UPF0716 family protein affecting phage T7 exclusion
MKFKYFQSKRWTALEVGVWFSVLIVTITLVILVATNVVGSWALIVACAIVAAVGLMRYRAETEQKKLNADDRYE